MTPTVSIILLNYNWRAFNSACLHSLLAQSYTQFEIIFVNNKSDDGSGESVQEEFAEAILAKKIIFVQPHENLWFAWGNNFGVQHASPESTYICLLNNDIIAPQNWLAELVQGIESNKQLWAVGSIIYDVGYEQEMDEFLFTNKKKWINNYFFDSVVVPQTHEDKEGTIIYTTGLSGCCLLYKRELVPEPFDEIYFAYMEDTALCLKILLQGYRLGMVKASHLSHLGSASFGKAPNVFKTFHGLKNYMLNFIILSQWRYRVAILPWFLLGLFFRTFFNHQWIRLQGWRKAIKRILTHRRTIRQVKQQTKKSIPAREFYRQLSAQFLCVPYYTHGSSIQKRVVAFLNRCSRFYFTLLCFPQWSKSL